MNEEVSKRKSEAENHQIELAEAESENREKNKDSNEERAAYLALEKELQQEGLSLGKRAELHKRKRQLLPSITFEKGEEFAEVIDNRYPWDKGAPLPHVFSDSLNTLLVYVLPRQRSSDWIDEPIEVLKEDEHSYDCAMISFSNPMDYRFGGLNDEVLAHTWLKGVEAYELHLVCNSRWLAALQKANAYHFSYNPASWSNLNHYYFAFHDETFECIAGGYSVELFHGYISDVAKVAVARLFR